MAQVKGELTIQRSHGVRVVTMTRQAAHSPRVRRIILVEPYQTIGICRLE